MLISAMAGSGTTLLINFFNNHGIQFSWTDTQVYYSKHNYSYNEEHWKNHWEPPIKDRIDLSTEDLAREYVYSTYPHVNLLFHTWGGRGYLEGYGDIIWLLRNPVDQYICATKEYRLYPDLINFTGEEDINHPKNVDAWLYGPISWAKKHHENAHKDMYGHIIYYDKAVEGFQEFFGPMVIDKLKRQWKPVSYTWEKFLNKETIERIQGEIPYDLHNGRTP